MKNRSSIGSTEKPAPTLLLVDDQELMRFVFGRVLKPEIEVNVAEASSVHEAWRKLDEGLNPDLVVTDLLMPDQDGFVLIKKMREDPRFKRKAVIVCTSRCDRETISMAAELGVMNYIQKPFTKAEVQRVVLESLDSNPQSHTFDDYLEAQKRLGLDQETYIQIAEMLSHEVSETISFVRSVLAHNYLQPALIRMRVLRNSSQTIGDQNLASAIMSTELLLERGDIPSVIAALETLGGENLRLLDSVDFIRQRQANRQSPVTSE